MNSIGSRIRSIRGKESRSSFAEKLNIGTATLQRYENDERSPDIEFLTKIQNITGYSLDYLVYGKETSVSNDEALLLEKYRQSTTEIKNKMLILLLSGDSESQKEIAAGSILNKGNGTQSNNVVNNNSSTVHGDQYNAKNQTFHRKESGFTDLPFSVAAFLCAFTAWLLGWLANHIGLTDKALSFDVGIPAILLWVMAIVLMVFATEKRKIIKKDKLILKGKL